MDRMAATTNASDPASEAAVPGEPSDQWPLWEVFTQPRSGAPHEHAGSIHAPDAELALQNARDVYARRGEAVHLWVVPSAAIVASTPGDAGPFFDPADDKPYRHPQFYRTPRGVRVYNPPRFAVTALVEYLLRLGDDRLVLGHRLSEWCGHGPILEEDIALANVALDLVGQASNFLRLAGQLEGQGRDEDALAYFREAVEFRNVKLVELPNGDYAHTIVRQFLFDAWSVLLLEQLQPASHAELAGIAAKAYKEARYHVRHSGEWVLRFGDGTEESHRRAQAALETLWPYTGELFAVDAVDRELAGTIAPDPAALAPRWREVVSDVVRRATLTLPADGYQQSGGRQGRHTEHLGHLLAEMQILARSHPGATW